MCSMSRRLRLRLYVWLTAGMRGIFLHFFPVNGRSAGVLICLKEAWAKHACIRYTECFRLKSRGLLSLLRHRGNAK